MKNKIKCFIVTVFLFFNRRGRRQLLWLVILTSIVAVITPNKIVIISTIVLFLSSYFIWTTVGHYVLTGIKAKKLLTKLNNSSARNFIDVSKQVDFNLLENYLGRFVKNGFHSGNADLDKPFHGILSCLNKFSFHRRFIVSLVEIDGEKFVRKRYTSCDKKFYQALRNNLLVQSLNISPSIKYVNIPDRTIWIEYVKGPTLTALSNNSFFPDSVLKNLIKKLTEFSSALHKLGFCNLDLHRGNIIIREHDGQPVFIDLDEQLLFKTNNPFFKLRCRIDKIKIAEEFELLIKTNQQNFKAPIYSKNKL